MLPPGVQNTCSIYEYPKYWSKGDSSHKGIHFIFKHNNTQNSKWTNQGFLSFKNSITISALNLWYGYDQTLGFLTPVVFLLKLSCQSCLTDKDWSNVNHHFGFHCLFLPPEMSSKVTLGLNILKVAQGWKYVNLSFPQNLASCYHVNKHLLQHAIQICQTPVRCTCLYMSCCSHEQADKL